MDDVCRVLHEMMRITKLHSIPTDIIPMKTLSTNFNLGIARFHIKLHPVFV
jgi:hypothetical protein